ncbi:glycosyltransferase [Pedobacter nanyangensis]|uniref:glycosyltransferase n=1 Tax=Pedobacter nanyangensis TaxID=1562389 RepID=UPI000DE3A3FE|nr:glycosyltransferase [Pedobacter nanyangensis]
MTEAIVITPVKNAIENTLQTIAAIKQSSIALEYIVYNDFSDNETTEALAQSAAQLGFELVNLEDITDTPSPNYNLVLEDAQRRALAKNLPLIVVESDVEVKPDTFSKLLDFNEKLPDAGMVGAVTVDDRGEINFPYLKFKGRTEDFTDTNRSLSFCCTLMSIPFLSSYSFKGLDRSKDWYDTIISKKSIALNFKNYILFNAPVYHKAHGSRPWKQLKYTNPWKYYWQKFTKGRDKI